MVPVTARLPTILSVSLLGLLLLLVLGLARFHPFSSQPIKPIDPASLTGDYDPSATVGEFLGQTVSPPPPATADRNLAQVLGDSNDETKRIEVDLTNQRLYAYENGRRVYEFVISSGKWGRTPTGSFRIWGKFRYTKMSGGRGNTYYYLPNVPYVMFFANNEIAASRGFSLHGTYWHNNFGYPMSHGCVNMRTEDAEKIYYWSQPHPGSPNATRASSNDPGTLIVIYGTAPGS